MQQNLICDMFFLSLFFFLGGGVPFMLGQQWGLLACCDRDRGTNVRTLCSEAHTFLLPVIQSGCSAVTLLFFFLFLP